MPRWSACFLAVFVLGLPRDARAVDFADVRDGFSFTIDAPGMPACVTYPIERFDRVECDGLDPVREATVRASAPAGTQWVGASVFRGDSWGFRLSITRADAPPGSMGETEDRALLSGSRESIASSLKPGQLVGGEAGLAGETKTVNGMPVARFAFTTKTEGVGVLRSIVYVVPAELGLYTVTLLADGAHAAELEKIADRAVPSLRVRRRPRASPLESILAFYVVLPLLALVGLGFLIVRLASSRRGGSATVSWPGLRDRGEP
jgi:hypothetical protein